MSAIQIAREVPLASVTLNQPEERNARAMLRGQARGVAIRGGARQGDDDKEGRRAFKEKRKPKFTGR